ncbi:hypothetical protein QBC47DRAFT_399735 [Echria macrotheca]|uniref:Uncharacterized protein n=1 Tax=Echria macrotheca TaxID=438768 RepID=A0AAJ0FBI7_9PEZI|nr:hypothetical protein QBC47DRAFT_399735 [Echria macrotheca]
MASIIATLGRRQFRDSGCVRGEDGFIDENSCYVPFWYTKTGVIVKWSLFLGFIVFIMLYLILGYMHAQKRIRKGLKPLAYHRFLVSRRQLAMVDPNYRPPQAVATPYYYGPGPDAYGMHAMPPPVYDPNSRPPVYPGPPPMGASKVDPSQPAAPPASGPADGDYAPPPGPPPPMGHQNTGSTNNPFRS